MWHVPGYARGNVMPTGHVMLGDLLCLSKHALIEPNAGSESVGAVQWLQLGLNEFHNYVLNEELWELEGRGG